MVINVKPGYAHFATYFTLVCFQNHGAATWWLSKVDYLASKNRWHIQHCTSLLLSWILFMIAFCLPQKKICHTCISQIKLIWHISSQRTFLNIWIPTLITLKNLCKLPRLLLSAPFMNDNAFCQHGGCGPAWSLLFFLNSRFEYMYTYLEAQPTSEWNNVSVVDDEKHWVFLFRLNSW